MCAYATNEDECAAGFQHGGQLLLGSRLSDCASCGISAHIIITQSAKTPSTGETVHTALLFFLIHQPPPTLSGNHHKTTWTLLLLLSLLPPPLRSILPNTSISESRQRGELSSPPLPRPDARREVVKCEKTSGLSRFGVRNSAPSPRRLVWTLGLRYWLVRDLAHIQSWRMRPPCSHSCLRFRSWQDGASPAAASLPSSDFFF